MGLKKMFSFIILGKLIDVFKIGKLKIQMFSR